ncbi:MAG TPA: hypothetical protein G4O02_12580 [Caldilineae bacterium]|nr:hypothetical protein [Caldilineae bacterium]
MITGAELIVGGLTLLAVLVYPLRRWAFMSALAGAVAGILLAMLSLRWPLDRVVSVWGHPVLLNRPLEGLGYTLVVTGAERPVLTMLGLAALAAFAGIRLRSSGRSFVPIGLVILALWAGAVIVHPMMGTLTGLLAASCLSAFIVQAGRTAPTRAAFRQVWWPLAAFMLMLVAGWHVQEMALRPDDATYLRMATWLIGISLLVLLAPVPLHAPFVSLLAEAPPVVGAFLAVGGQVVVLHLIWDVFLQWPWLSEHMAVSRALTATGLITLLWGAMGALSAGRARRLWAYAALHDWGVFLVGFGLGAPLEWRMAAALFVGRALSLFLSAYGFTNLESHGIADDLEAVRGLMRRLPWTVLAILVGGLGLAGFPLTASFGLRWTLIQTLLRTRPVWGLLIVVGQLGVSLGYLRLLQSFWAPLPPSRRLIPRERLSSGLLLIVGVVLSGGLALIPQLLDGVVRMMIEIVVQISRPGM